MKTVAQELAAAAEKAKRTKHYVTIYVRGCDTTRDCYCLRSNGRDHEETDLFPWVGSDGITCPASRKGVPETPLEYPLLRDETPDEYEVRLVAIAAYKRGYSEGHHDGARSTTNDEPEYPENPYLTEGP